MRKLLTTSLLTVAVSSPFVTAQQALWKAFDTTPAPSARWDAPMVYDSARDRVVLIGGVQGTSSPVGGTWEHDGTQWLLRTQLGPSGGPGELAAVYDSVRQVTVLIQNGFPRLSVWEWDGVAWTQYSLASAPGQRVGFAAAFDPVHGKTVMFGGRLGANPYYSDTWEWDGVGWTQRGTGGPYPRTSHKMVYDAARDVIVLFGGQNDEISQDFGDTWEWNGSYWYEYYGVPGPSARYEHAMVYDALRQRTVVIGGRTRGGAQYLEAREWDGSTWHNAGGSAPASSGLSLAYDVQRQRTLAFGGRIVFGSVLDGTDLYTATSIVASVTAYGTGCAGPDGTPQLFVQSGTARLGSTLTVRLNTMQTGLLNLPVMWLGYDDQQWNGLPLPLPLDGAGFPGCTALLAPSAAYVLAGGVGYGTWSTSLPFLPQFLGLEFYLQGGVLVLGYNPGGLVFSNGLHGVVGR